MKVIVVGCGRLGSELSYRLSLRGHDVAVIDYTPAAFHSLPLDFKGRTHEGDAMNQDVLFRAGIKDAEALAAVTNSDSLNMVVGHVARMVYHVPSVVARNYDPVLRTLFESFGLQVISSTTWGAQRLEELIHHSEIQAVFSAGNGEVEIYEFIIPEKLEGRTLEEIIPCENCIVISITRGGKAILPSKNITLKSGDLVHVSATFEGVEDLRKQLTAVGG
jgi:trk system potassium uptake protein TrkA